MTTDLCWFTGGGPLDGEVREHIVAPVIVAPVMRPLHTLEPGDTWYGVAEYAWSHESVDGQVYALRQWSHESVDGLRQ